MEESIKLWFKEGLTDFDSQNGLNRENPFELKRLNVLVGANNAGKSRFMRNFGIAISKELDIYLSTDITNKLDEINSWFMRVTKQDLKLETPLPTTYKAIIEKIDKAVSIIEDVNSRYEKLRTNSVIIYNNTNRDLQNIDKYTLSTSRNFTDEVNLFNDDLTRLKDDLCYLNFEMYNHFYLDTLRSLKKIIGQNKEINFFPLLNRTLQDYSFNEGQIISGEDFFELLTDSLLGKPDQRQRIQEYQQKLSHYFFNNETVTIIPHLKNDSIEIKIGDEKQFPISQLGDGLQQIIILTYKAFLTTETSFFFIEEPEMHLHAGYVKQLMKFLLDETDHYYMATSHSNYLLDMINEDNRIALYRVDKKPLEDDKSKNETVIKRCDGDRTILQTLGVSPSSVFLANCTIWVEGITDRLYFVQYLKKYLEELKENDAEKWKDYSRFIDGYHYAFVEYQGSNLDHWDFSIDLPEDVDSSRDKGLNALLTTSNALVIADSDLQDKDRFSEIAEQLGDNIVITTGKETENTLPKKLIIKRFYQKCPHDAISRKGNKTKIAFSDEHLKYFDDSYESSNKGIGLYLDGVIDKMRKADIFPTLEVDQKSFTFRDNGKQGTVKEKTDFCHSIVELMQNEDWMLTDSAKTLCEAIFEHVKKHND